MSPMFGGKKSAGKTVALIDIESGSVGAALARLSRHEAPKLFAETRVSVPVLHTRDTHTLLRAIERATEEALAHMSQVATRLRTHESVRSHGEVAQASVFFSAPWASMHLQGGTADIAEPLRKSTHLTVRSTLGEIPTSFHPLGTAAAHSSLVLYPKLGTLVLCVVHAELSELLVITNGTLVARATVPAGHHTLVRTLMSHTGMNATEARSYISLPQHHATALQEALTSAEDHVVSQIEDALREIAGAVPLGSVVVVAREPVAELVARALTRHERVAELFPEGGMVRATKPAHVMPFIAAHAKNPDLHLMLEALFVDAKFGGI